MSIKEKLRMAALDFLQIQPAPEQQINLYESTGFAANVIRNKVWYRGDPSELSQLAKQLSGTGQDDTASTRFWAQVPEVGSIRKAHAGLPAIMVDTLAYIVKADLDEFDFGKDGKAKQYKERWTAMAKDNEFSDLIGQAITDTLVTADGAFKISIDPEISDHPLLEFWPADQVDYEMRRGRCVTVLFNSWHEDEKGRKWKLVERYAKGSVAYELYDSNGNPRELDDLPALSRLQNASFDGDFSLAVPLRFFKSTRFPGRGRSLYDKKIDAFDAHDEVISQWIDAIRAGRVIRYIPDDLVPRNPEDGTTTAPSYFQSNYIVTGHSSKEDAQSKLDMQQAEIDYEAFVASYSATLDQALQGIMSPATLGIDVGKMASADAQREKKDITGFTRNAITDALESTLPKVVTAMLMADDLMHDQEPGTYDLPTISFGEYGAPDFDSRVDTVAKARTAGIMSLQKAVEELWGGSMSEKDQEEEVSRLQAEQGIEEPDPALASVPGGAVPIGFSTPGVDTAPKG